MGQNESSIDSEGQAQVTEELSRALVTESF